MVEIMESVDPEGDTPGIFYAVARSYRSRFADRRRPGRVAKGALFFELLLQPVQPEAPTSASVDVRWDAPTGCPGHDEVVARVLVQAGSSAPADASVSVSGHVYELATGRWALSLTVQAHPRGGAAIPVPVDRRSLEGESCEAVTDAAALIVALRWTAPEAAPGSATELTPTMIPPPDQHHVPVAFDAPEQPSSGRAAAVDAVAELSGPVPISPRRGPTLPWLATSGGLALRILPGLGGAAALAGGVAGRWWRVGVLARAYPKRTVDHPQGNPPGSVSGRFDLVTGGLVACGTPALGGFEFPLCGRVEVGGVRGEGDGTVSQTRWSPWVGLGGSAQASWWGLGWLAPFVAVEGVGSLLAPGFTVGTLPGTIYRVRRIGLRAWAGFEFRVEIGSTKKTSR